MHASPPPLNIGINRLQHVGLPVTNLEVSKSFYAGLGFSVVMTSIFSRPEGTGHVCMVQRGDIVIELYQMPEAELQDVRNRSDGHIDHIAFDVDDVESAYKQLKEAGYAVVEKVPVFLPFWKNGCRFFFILGLDGERLEFNQIL